MGGRESKQAATGAKAASGGINGITNSTINFYEQIDLHAQTHAHLQDVKTTINSLLIVVLASLILLAIVVYAIYHRWQKKRQQIKIDRAVQVEIARRLEEALPPNALPQRYASTATLQPRNKYCILTCINKAVYRDITLCL